MSAALNAARGGPIAKAAWLVVAAAALAGGSAWGLLAGLESQGQRLTPAAAWWALGLALAVGLVGAVLLLAGLRPLQRVLARRPAALEPGRAAARALAVPAAWMGLGLLGALGATVALVWREQVGGCDPLTRGAVCALALAGLVAGLGQAVALRRLLRPAIVGLGLLEVPVVWRFGLLPRLLATLVLLTAIGLFAVAWIESRFSLTLSPGVTRSAPGWWLWTPLWLGFAGLCGALVGLGVRGRTRWLTGRIERMAREEQAPLRSLPVVSATEAGWIATAFNRLAQSVEVEQTRLKEYSERVARADRMQARFLRNVSHELRTPLNSIIGFSDLLLRVNTEALSEQNREAVEVINRSGERLLGLINDILMMAQFEADRAVCLPGPERLGVMVREILASWSQAERVEPPVEMEPRDAEREVSVDRTLLERALRAMLDCLPVEASGSPAGLRVEWGLAGLRIQTPIAPDAWQAGQEEALFQGAAGVQAVAGGRSGRRLGLALGRRIARLHGGDLVRIESESGSVLELRIPA